MQRPASLRSGYEHRILGDRCEQWLDAVNWGDGVRLEQLTHEEVQIVGPRAWATATRSPSARQSDSRARRSHPSWRRSGQRALNWDTAVVAYDVDLADRLREILAAEPDVTEKRMFGGLAFMVAGHMAVSVSGQGGLLLRIDPAQTETLVGDPQANRFVMRGREMDGWLRVDLDARATDVDLTRWVRHGVGYARSMPPK